MESDEQRVPILDFLYRKSDMNSQGFSVQKVIERTVLV